MYSMIWVFASRRHRDVHLLRTLELRAWNQIVSNAS